MVDNFVEPILREIAIRLQNLGLEQHQTHFVAQV